MTRKHLLAACAFGVLAIASAQPAMAQVATPAGSTGTQTLPSQEPDQAVPDVVVTGSIIRGTPEDAALPVDVIGADELARQGSPSVVELLKALPTSSGVLGDSNQFDSRSQGAEGIATVNLRGLSPQRTLVLLNSRRLATAGNGIPAVDINLLPQAAIGRIEVLKDGAAATYGSEAIAGVVNFITRTDQEGFNVAGSYKNVRDTDGDFDASVSYGHRGDNFRVLFAAGFQKRGELLARNREFAVQPYLNNPQGGWTGGGNPASFILTAPFAVSPSGLLAAAPQPDSSCAPLGGYVGANGRCYTQYSPFDALVDLEKRGQAFIDAEFDLSPHSQLEVTVLYGRSTVPHYLTSPSYILTQTPSLVALGGTNPTAIPGFYVPASNPGYIAYKAANPAAFAGAGAFANGAIFPLLLFRPYLTGGNPSTLGDPEETGSSRGMRKSESFRATAELRGEIGSGLDYSLSGTYHDYSRYIDGYDEFGDRVELALRGFGGPNCNIAANTPGANGCLYLNPFGNAVTVNAATGATNPQGNPALANSAQLTNWFFVRSATVVDTELFVGDASLSGSTGLHLPGGDAQFGVGAQYRQSWFDTRYFANNNIAQNPCRETPINGNVNPAACAPTNVGGAANAPNGALGFLGTNRNSVVNGGVYALFGELQLPVLPSLNLQLGARYEDYGGGVGSTFDPQARARFQVTSWLALRGGIGTTFRAPTLANITPGSVTSLQLIGSSFKPVDVFGNSALKPETSVNYSAGILLKFGGFTASADYFRYNLEKAIIFDPLSAMVATLFPSSGGNTCAANAALAARFTFGGAACTPATTVASISRVTTYLQNGPKQTNEGIDFNAEYHSHDMFGSSGRFGIGGTFTYVLQNRIGDIYVAGTRVSAAFDGVGLLNYQTSIYPVPKWKGQGFVEAGSGGIDARVTVNYIDGLHDQRADTLTGPFALDTSITTAGTRLLQGANLNEFVTADFTLKWATPWGTTLTGSVLNFLDAQPPFAREDYNYEPFVANPLGREFKIGFSQKF